MPRRDDEFESQRDYERRPRREEEEDLPPPRRQAAPEKSSSALILILVLGGVGALLVCVACGGVGAYFLLRAKDSDRMVRGNNNLRQIGIAVHNCNDTFGELPLVSGHWRGEPQFNNPPQRSFFFCLLPFVEQDNLFKMHLNGGHGPIDVPVRVYFDPEDKTGSGTLGECSYGANWQAFQAQTRTTIANPALGQFPTYAAISRSFMDGTSNTVIFAEIYQNCNGTVRKWAQTGNANDFRTPAFNRDANQTNLVNNSLQFPQFGPKPEECQPSLAQAPYTSGVPVGVGDGSVRAISPKISIITWQRICCPSDGQVIGGDW